MTLLLRGCLQMLTKPQYAGASPQSTQCVFHFAPVSAIVAPRHVNGGVTGQLCHQFNWHPAHQQQGDAGGPERVAATGLVESCLVEAAPDYRVDTLPAQLPPGDFGCAAPATKTSKQRRVRFMTDPDRLDIGADPPRWLSPCSTSGCPMQPSFQTVFCTKSLEWTALSFSCTSQPTVLRLYRSMIMYRKKNRPRTAAGSQVISQHQTVLGAVAQCVTGGLATEGLRARPR